MSSGIAIQASATAGGPVPIDDTVPSLGTKVVAASLSKSVLWHVTVAVSGNTYHRRVIALNNGGTPEWSSTEAQGPGEPYTLSVADNAGTTELSVTNLLPSLMTTSILPVVELA